MHQELNVIYCELFALQAFEGAHNPLDEIKGENRGKLSSASKSRSQTITMDKQREAVEEFVIQYLRGSATDKTVPVQSPSSQSYISLLPTLWWLLGQENCQKRDGPEEILQSVLTHATKASPTSNVKQIATEFIARLLLVWYDDFESSYQAKSHTGTVGNWLSRPCSSWLPIIRCNSVRFSFVDDASAKSAVVYRRQGSKEHRSMSR